MSDKDIKTKARRLYKFGDGPSDDFSDGGYEGFQDGARWAYIRAVDDFAEYLQAHMGDNVTDDLITDMSHEIKVKPTF